MAVRAIGQVTRIYATGGVTYIRLGGIPANVTPKDGYFKLLQSHANYNALYSLALASAVNRYNLHIRTNEDIVSTEHAIVNYMVVDW